MVVVSVLVVIAWPVECLGACAPQYIYGNVRCTGRCGRCGGGYARYVVVYAIVPLSYRWRGRLGGITLGVIPQIMTVHKWRDVGSPFVIPISPLH